MRSTVIAAITTAAMTSGRRDAPSGFTVMSGAIVTAALFANLGGGVNAGDDRRVGKAKRAHHQDMGIKVVGTARKGAPLPTLRFRNLAAYVIPQPVHIRN